MKSIETNRQPHKKCRLPEKFLNLSKLQQNNVLKTCEGYTQVRRLHNVGAGNYPSFTQHIMLALNVKMFGVVAWLFARQNVPIIWYPIVFLSTKMFQIFGTTQAKPLGRCPAVRNFQRLRFLGAKPTTNTFHWGYFGVPL